MSNKSKKILKRLIWGAFILLGVLLIITAHLIDQKIIPEEVYGTFLKKMLIAYGLLPLPIWVITERLKSKE